MMPIGAPGGPGGLAGLDLATIHRVRLLDDSLADLTIEAGRIVGVEPTVANLRTSDAVQLDSEEPAAINLDASGWRFIPGASEPHAHLDKALTAGRPSTGGPSTGSGSGAGSGSGGNDLFGAIEAWQEIQVDIDADDIYRRALTAVHRYVANGITTIRTHVDAGRGLPGQRDPLRGVEAMIRLQDALAGRVRLQTCLLAGPMTPDWVIDEAVARGVDVIGGCPHVADDPSAETTRMLDFAEKYCLPVDLHTDEQTAATTVDLVDLAEQTLARGLTQRVTASHCCRLGSLPPKRLQPVLELVARAGIGIVALPITNLYLQGWDATHLPPRGLTAVREILDAGIDLAAGADNLRDPFNPAGRADPFETTSLLMTAAHLAPNAALAAVTTGARTVLGFGPVGAVPGADADFMLVPEMELGDVLAGVDEARIVVHGGHVVADTRVSRDWDLFAGTTDPLKDSPAVPHSIRSRP